MSDELHMPILHCSVFKSSVSRKKLITRIFVRDWFRKYVRSGWWWPWLFSLSSLDAIDLPDSLFFPIQANHSTHTRDLSVSTSPANSFKTRDISKVASARLLRHCFTGKIRAFNCASRVSNKAALHCRCRADNSRHHLFLTKPLINVDVAAVPITAPPWRSVRTAL